MMRQPRHSRGFTLVETLVYLSLYAIIMTGAMTSVYALTSSSARIQTKALMQEEGSFLIGKIDWALTGVQTVSLPASNGSGNNLTVTKYDTGAGNPIIIALTNSNLVISRAGAAFQVLNDSNVIVTCPPAGCFTHTSASGDGINPESVSATMTIHATTSEGFPLKQDFYTIKYLRK